jgi:ABC-type transport system involved in multi-copper enzyme maturation permease subunit
MWTLGATVLLGIGLSALVAAETTAHWVPSDRFGFDATRVSLIGVFFGQFTIGILGVLVMSAEYGTGTIRATFSAAPRRSLVLAAKALVFGAVALVISEAVAFAAYALGQALLSAPAIHTTLSSPGALRAVAGSGLYLCVLGLLGLGLASIIRHTAGAICAFIGVLLVLPLIVQALPTSLSNSIDRFLPANIGSAMVSLQPGAHSFSAWPSFLLLCAYAAGALVIGGALLTRRDA